MTGSYGTQSDPWSNSTENLNKYRIISIILIATGIAFITFYAFSMHSYYGDGDTLFFGDREQQIDVSHGILGIGWALWPIGMVFGIKAVILKQGRSIFEIPRCLQFTAAGAVMIAAGWLLLAAFDWQRDKIDDENMLRNLMGIYYLLIGIGFFLIGQGLRVGFREMMEGSLTKKGGSLSKYSLLPLVGGIFHGVGMGILGILMLLDHGEDINAYYSAMYSLRGIGLFVLILGIILAFHTSFKPGGRTTIKRGPYSRPGIISIILMFIAAGILLYSFTQRSLLFYAYHTGSRDLYMRLGEFSIESFYYYLAIGYGIMAAALPIAVWSGTSMTKEKEDISENPLFTGLGQPDLGATSASPHSPSPPQNQGNSYYQQQTITTPTMPQYSGQPPVSSPYQTQQQQQHQQQMGYQQTGPVYNPGSQINPSNIPQTAIWTCQNCGSNSPQTQAFCSTCGQGKQQ